VRRWRYLLILLFLLGIGCAPMMESNPPVLVGASIERPRIIEDEFRPFVEILGLDIYVDVKPEEIVEREYYQYLLRTFITKKDSSMTHQLYVKYRYTDEDWRFYHSAYLKGGVPLEFVEIDSKVLGKNFLMEMFGITIPDSILRRDTSGFAVKVYAKSGNNFVVNVTPDQVKQQLTAINAYFKGDTTFFHSDVEVKNPQKEESTILTGIVKAMLLAAIVLLLAASTK